MGLIREFYSGKNVLISGATGFCGKVLVEKLLRSCEGIGQIYILVRKKKNVSPKDRFVAYINHFIFDDIRKSNENILKKMILISGDIAIEKLDLSNDDETTLINDVDIIFHCAANVKFNDPLKDAVNINVNGTLRLLQLAEKMKHLVVFSYMSTSFCQSYQEELEERHYPSKCDPFRIIDKTHLMNENELIVLEKDLLAQTKHPNTYTLSKALAEDVAFSFHQKLPIVIIRPSLVWYANEEPFKGYVEGLSSGIGIIAGGFTGLIRSMLVGDKANAKITPVDFVINATIASAWRSSLSSQKQLLVYNCTDSEENPFPWKYSAVVAEKPFFDFAPSEKLFWYPKITYTSSYVWHMISIFLFQLLPAILFDFVKILFGGKPMLTSLQLKIVDSMSIFYYFTTRNFKFDTKKLFELFEELDADDRKNFNFNHNAIKWLDYHYNGGRQIRRLVLKEDESTIPKAQKLVARFYYAGLILKAVGFIALLYYGYSFGSKLMNS